MSIQFHRPNAALLCVLLIVSSAAAYAGEIRTERVTFAKSTSGTVIEGKIAGERIVDYLLGAAAGQVMSVDMRTSNGGNYFNILPHGSDEALFIGSRDGDIADVRLPVSGDYVIRVYLMRNAARRNETANYSLAIGIGPPDFADGLAGGPDYWRVDGVGGGDALNVRSGPSTRYAVVSKLQNGQVVRNDGCRMRGDKRWCEIRATGSGQRGWVAGRYLIEAAPPPEPAIPPGGPTGAGVPFDATGATPCAVAAGQPTTPCPFGAVRDGPGNAGVWIAVGNGDERYILFEGGAPVATDASGAFSYRKNADLYLIDIGDERYEIPEAVVYGG